MPHDIPTPTEMWIAKVLIAVKKILCCPPSLRLELASKMLAVAEDYPQVDDED